MREGLMSYGTKKIEDFILNPHNLRTIKQTQLDRLKQSIQDLPEMMFLRPVIINKDGVVLGGNMRLKAIMELGYSEAPYIQIEDLTPEQEQEFIIKDNESFGELEQNVREHPHPETTLKQIVLQLPEKEYNILYDELLVIKGRECLTSYGEVVNFLLTEYKSKTRIYGKD